MAMNFKVFNDQEAVSAYVSDLLRKQVYSNKKSVLALESHKKLEWTYEKFVGETKRYPVDLSQVYISTINNDGNLSMLNNLELPADQLYTDGKAGSIERILENRKAVNLALLYLDEDGEVGFNGYDNESIFAARELVITAIGSESAQVVKALYNASENNKDGFSGIKSHRMVTVALDQEAASALDKDIVDYYSYKFA